MHDTHTELESPGPPAKTKPWTYIKTCYWVLVFCTAAFFYWLLYSTLF